jgi:hypothetical protein
MVDLQNGKITLDGKEAETMYYALDRLYEVNLLSSEEMRIYKLLESIYGFKSKY